MSSSTGRGSAQSVPFTGNLPSEVRTLSGVTFNPTLDHWKYADGVQNISLNFTVFHSFSAHLIASAKSTLVWYAQNRAPRTLTDSYQALHHFHDSLGPKKNGLTEVTDMELLNYRTKLGARTLYRSGVLGGLLKRWKKLGYSGVTDSVIAQIEDLRTPGNPKGEAVLTWDPRTGPMTDIEFEAMYCALNDAYGDSAISREEYLLGSLEAAFGQRPCQYASLKVCDARGVDVEAGKHTYELNMPRAKKGDKNSRGSFTLRPLVTQIGEILIVHAKAIEAEFSGRLLDTSKAPLFPSRGGPNVKARKGSEGFEFHQSAGGLGAQIASVFARLKIHSERLSGIMPLTAIRFRRTLGTRAAAAGCNPYVIAEMLDQADTQQVGVYSACSPAILERIDKALAMHLAPLAQAFSGVLIRDESEATRGSDPTSRIIDLRIDQQGAPMGSCGEYSFCGFSAPIACYTCRSFEPWLDGPHEAVLEHLLAKREKLIVTTDKRIASINDRTILAVADVIRRVTETRQGLKNE